VELAPELRARGGEENEGQDFVRPIDDSRKREKDTSCSGHMPVRYKRIYEIIGVLRVVGQKICILSG